MRLESHHATGHASVGGFAAHKGEHGLVASVHAVEITDGQGASRGQLGVM
jgi:hypothetical protein